MTVNTIPVEPIAKPSPASAAESAESEWPTTLPDDVREVTRVGNRAVALTCGDGRVVMMNAAVYAINILHEGMKGEFEKAGIYSEDDVVELVKEIRREMAAEQMTAAERGQAAPSTWEPSEPQPEPAFAAPWTCAAEPAHPQQ